MGKLKGRGRPSRLGAPPRNPRFNQSMPPNGGARRSPNRPINTARWQKARAAFIAEKVQEAAERGDVLRCAKTQVPLLGVHPAPDSPVVDHIVADRGDLALFWERSNWQVVSKAWHDREKQRLEKLGLA